MALRPPQHSVDAPIVYVSAQDDAWDNDRIDAERDNMRLAGEDPDRHPAMVYRSGASRFDLNAAHSVCGELKSAGQYIDEAKGPWRWRLKRLGFDDFYRVHSMMGASYDLACIAAFKIGVESVEGPGAPRLHQRAGKLSQADEDAVKACSPALPIELGSAVYVASLPLSEPEKK